ncbi:hypothetical protein MBAV_003579 [Candidatus Magnetobacterium bavaricum]|uniref:Uncharacterized protein n=1 Tax=Candidatus Magnetobacterium bavaricum TaxID=29290 RepID=A0A0F3GQW8_9BACT|nr:hypothetical protein MBAV_003579 [Candidatus Magnetobacterium bavaricum]
MLFVTAYVFYVLTSSFFISSKYLPKVSPDLMNAPRRKRRGIEPEEINETLLTLITIVRCQSNWGSPAEIVIFNVWTFD